MTLSSPSHPSRFLLASNFYNSRGVTVRWFDSKIVIFLLQKCLGQNQLLTESLPQNGTGSPGGQDVPIPVPASPSLPVCPWAAQSSRSSPAGAAGCRLHTGGRAALSHVHQEVRLSSLSSRNPRRTIYHDQQQCTKGLGVRATYKDVSWKPSPCNALNSALAAPKKRWLAGGLDTAQWGWWSHVQSYFNNH